MKDSETKFDVETSGPVIKVLSRLEEVRRLGPGHYAARCPIHNDTDIPLTIIEGEDGRALVECDDGCWLDDLVPALGLTVEDLFQCIDDIYTGSEAPKYEAPQPI